MPTYSQDELQNRLTKPGWQVFELPTGHWPMFSRPRDLAELLGSLVQK